MSEYMAFLYTDGFGKLVSCYFVFKQRFLCVLKMFGTFHGKCRLQKDQAF